MNEYRVNLDIYNGPLDLLLYLIRRDEVDIYDIPIARVTAQYVRYVDLLKELDANLAGEFLVMAATLMEIKTRMLLPAAPADQGEEAAELSDPRAELVRQLLEYKAFKDAAGELGDAAAEQAMRFPRPHAPAPGTGEVELEDVHVWNLVDAFAEVLKGIGQADDKQEVIYDDTPIELHAADILDRLHRHGPVTFARIFEGRTARAEIVGLFMALLELVRVGKVLVGQDRNFGRIRVLLNPQPPAEGAPEHFAPQGLAPDDEPPEDQAAGS